MMRNVRLPRRSLSGACCLLGLASALVLAYGSSFAQAQAPFQWDTLDAAYSDARQVSAQLGTKTNIVMGRAGLASNQATLEDWYRKYLFPAMAAQDRLGDLADNRDSLMKDLERAADATIHQLIVDIAYDEATKRVTGNYHPIVRYNALLIIGGLNQTEQRLVGTDRYPAIRLAKALDFLWAELQKPDQIDILRVAALLGLERHFFLVKQRPQDQPVPDARRAEVASLMQTWAEQKEPPAGRSADAHAWIRRKAMEVLGAVGQVGDGQAIFNSLLAIASDTNETFSVRCSAARALGELNYTNITGIDAVATTQKLAALAAAACRSEDSWVKEQQKELDKQTRKPGGGMDTMGGMGGMAGMASMMGGTGAMSSMLPSPGTGGSGGAGMAGYPGMGSGGGGYPGGPSGMGFGMVSEEMENLMDDARRRLKYPVFCVQLGIRGEERRSGIGAADASALGSFAQLAADDAQKAEIQKILTALDAIIVATDLVEEPLEEMMTKVRDKTRALEAMLPQVEEPGDDTDAADLPGGDLPGGSAEPAAAATEPAAPAATE